MGLGWQELVIVLVIVIIIFGAGKLPEIGGSLGKGIKEFRASAQDAAADSGTLKTTSSKTISEEL